MLPLSQDNIFDQELNLKCAITKHDVWLEGPQRLGYFSCFDNGDNSVFSQDKSALRFLQLPDSVSINCLQGYDPDVKYGHVVSRDMLLLRWILDNEETVRKFPSDFICSNGILKDMMTVEYANDDWNLSATKIRGKIVLNKIESDEKKEYIDTQSEWSNKSTFTAFNLMRLITKPKDGYEHIASREYEDSFYSVFHSKIGSHRILHSGWLHCVGSKEELDKPFDKMEFVLIKKFNAPRESQSSFQSSVWWSLATLAGIDTIFRAKWEQDFTVENIDKLNVDNLIYRSNQRKFVASLNNILDYIKSIVTEENKCYNFHFKGKDKKLTVSMKKDLDDNPIPSWYIDGQLHNKSH